MHTSTIYQHVHNDAAIVDSNRYYPIPMHDLVLLISLQYQYQCGSLHEYDGWLDRWQKNAPYFNALRPKAVVACASHHLQSSPCTYLYINLQYPSVLPFSPAFVRPWFVGCLLFCCDVRAGRILLRGFGGRRVSTGLERQAGR